MKVFKISYELNGVNYVAGILADEKDKAIHFLKKVVKNIKSINSISTEGTEIHGIDDAIVNRIIKKNKDSIEADYDKKIQSLRVKLRDAQQELYENETKMKEQEKELVNLRAELLTKRETIYETVKLYLCDICDAEMKTKAGLKAHKSKMHKD